MEYYAHTSEDGMRRQTVAAHCRKAASYAAECLSSVGLSNTAYLAGLMHDTGKLTQEYQTYLERAARGEAVRRGSVVHTFAGVRFLLEHYHGSKHDSSFNDITCELLAFAVGAHHGLFDCIDENHASGFLHRLQSHDSEYQEAIKNAEMHLITRDETNQLFQASCEEMSIIFEKIQKILDFESSQENDLYFYVSLIARLLLSAVIQGDRRDTTEFVTGISRLPHTKDMRDIFLGTRECQGYVEPCVFDEGSSPYDEIQELSFGLMYHGITYADEAYSADTAGHMTANFWNAVMRKGIITFPKPKECPLHKTLGEMPVKPFGASLQNFTGLREFGEVD